MSGQLLTIIVPTFNRAKFLMLLLSVLKIELKGLDGKVNVLIGDNASTDDTQMVCSLFQAHYSNADTIRHSENLGPDENFCRCVDLVRTRFFWIIGDDDLPKSGVVGKIVDFLEHEEVDLLYLNSEWMPSIISSSDGVRITSLGNNYLSREIFARRVNVWITFISGMIVNRDRLYSLNPGLNIRKFSGTSLVQLGWVLPILMTGDRFGFVESRCVLATSGNTGGYKLLTVFGSNFPVILDAVCGRKSKIKKVISRWLEWSYLPNLLWMSRFGRGGAFYSENTLDALVALRSTLAYWLILLPMAFFPRFISLFFYVTSRLIVKLFFCK